MEHKIISNVDASKYVVFDVETNGKSSIRDDLLSISIYKPDTEEMFNRFLPLELQNEVMTTHINGIKTSKLKGLEPLSQSEVDEIIDRFELKKRVILTYGNLDEKFIDKYFQRHNLRGIEFFSFYNFKHEIISSKFSEGNITKDNLCNLYGIENVQRVHSGTNDCVLEWKLFEKMNGHRLLITNNQVFEFNNQYLVPASYITTFPNMKYYLPLLPQIKCETKTVFSLSVPAEKLRKFPTNFNGMILEHLINSMLQVQKVDSLKQLIENKSCLKYLGELPSVIEPVPMIFNPDGSMVAIRPQDKKLEKDINNVIKAAKSLLEPVLQFIAEEIFRDTVVSSQELMIYPEQKVLAVCDLSSGKAVLEIKAARSTDVQRYAEQLYYEANGRKCYVLQTDWSKYPQELVYIIKEVDFTVESSKDSRQARFEKAKKRIETKDIMLVEFIDSKTPVKLRCNKCGTEWNSSYNIAVKHRSCPKCASVAQLENKKIGYRRKRKPVSTEEERQKKKLTMYKEKLDQRSEYTIEVMEYVDSKSAVKARCKKCGYEWSCSRADHLLARPYCPRCKRLNRNYKRLISEKQN